ncbi:glucose-6-phosphate 1-epimerase-like protein [Trifolium pratense]|uniref:Glucose-6-phosphate 1-epimerase-like protein n=1 Tax=Trifolium pratense TaxID=57577 RepID=A0A2K3L480_TRIPR|nr:glucose-6-phosphate 1-epimerase-like protein [Trifolium pratense]
MNRSRFTEQADAITFDGEAAAIDTAILLKPCEEWKGYQELSTVSSSYCSGQLDPRRVLYGFH